MDLYQSEIFFIFCLFIAGLFWRIHQMDLYQSGIFFIFYLFIAGLFCRIWWILQNSHADGPVPVWDNFHFLPLHCRAILENPPDGPVPVWDIFHFLPLHCRALLENPPDGLKPVWNIFHFLPLHCRAILENPPDGPVSVWNTVQASQCYYQTCSVAMRRVARKRLTPTPIPR